MIDSIARISRENWPLLVLALACACSGGRVVEGADSGPTSGSEEASGASTSPPNTTGTDLPSGLCTAPQPIFMRGSAIPSGFVRCANGLVHRVEVVECAVEGKGACQWNGECTQDSDCVDAPHGTCHELPTIGCYCKYGCGSDADCDDGEICACAGVVSDISQCVPSGCLDDGGCAPGLCALSVGRGGCGFYAAAADCIDATSPCLATPDCDEPGPGVDPECLACLPEAGAWKCGQFPDCGAIC